MNVVTIDFETYWTTEFSLSKISFMEYIKSPDFQTHSVSIKHGDGQTSTYFGSAVGPALQAVNWEKTACVAHNGNEFDFPLLVWLYDCHPKLFVDTLCLSRPKHQSEVGGSLKKLSTAYGLAEKDNTILLNTRGKRLEEFTSTELAAMRVYNAQDVDNTYALFKTFSVPDVVEEDLRVTVRRTAWHKKELLLSDMTARMICYPKFRCDTALLRETLNQAEVIKQAQLVQAVEHLGVMTLEEALKELSSSQKFADALIRLGVDPPTKVSPRTGKETYAFAKTDQDFTNLQSHPDERVQILVGARLGVKSTLLETRLATMARCADAMDGAMPVPLAYHSATTGRWGGRVWNPQNLPRIPRDKQGNIVPKLTNALRLSLVAPPGHKVVTSDLSGIELRVNHYLWAVESTAALYEKDPKADLYTEFAVFLYNKLREEVTKEERQLAKVAQLGLGFGAGALTFQRVARLMGGIELDIEQARRITYAWREAYRNITYGWTTCEQAVLAMLRNNSFSPDPRSLVRTRGMTLLLPSGRTLHYPNIRNESGDMRGSRVFVYGEGKNKSKLWGGLVCENIVQAIARDVIAEAALKIKAQTGHDPVHTVHDELAYVVPDSEAAGHLARINEIMRTPPEWLPGIVLWSEGDIAQSYGESK